MLMPNAYGDLTSGAVYVFSINLIIQTVFPMFVDF